MINKKDIEAAIEGLSVIEKKPDPPVKIDVSKMSSVEKRHMDAFVARGMPGIEAYDKERMLEAYLAGADVQEIVQMFPNAEAGGIIYLKNSESWNTLRREYVEDLNYKSTVKLMQTRANAVSSISMLINLFHKEIQPKILKYMATGDSQYLPKRFGIKTFQDYNRFVILLGKISKLSPGDPISLDPPQTVNIKAGTVTLGDDNRKIETTQAEKTDEHAQSVAHKLLAELYGGK